MSQSHLPDRQCRFCGRMYNSHILTQLGLDDYCCIDCQYFVYELFTLKYSQGILDYVNTNTIDDTQICNFFTTNCQKLDSCKIKYIPFGFTTLLIT